MAKVNIKIAELRKQKQIGQQELAEVLGVTYQSVSKWETGTTMPDITLLPAISEYFKVSVDELLGLKPLCEQQYMQRNTDDRTSWNESTDKLFQNRKNFWNEDYLKFLVENVWHITSPISVIDFWCGDGYLGKKLLEVLPKGSSYTGIDNTYFIKKATETFMDTDISTEFIESDLYNINIDKKFDLAICQACLRHLNRPMEVLANMAEVVRIGGMVVCVEVNREFENVGTYIDGINYDDLCTNFDYHPLWKTELENEGRDYAIGMRLPFYMEQLGLQDINVRMNDKVMFTSAQNSDYQKDLQEFMQINGWDKIRGIIENESLIEFFMNRGIARVDAEKFVMMQAKIAHHLTQTEIKKSILKVQGLMITYGIK
ncbi:class I SAM-dependent methyltransferase [Anaerocolumna cellulosilytica]|uniref:Class I SAM-dependent methyltransferase n=1 Tax=Anaerocolumna cellulosilytica TaxID=433286 RepID=A0A6S6QU12_9FIRM|nr:helix-turn-helix domain-containing protein [Anaerocolumna cellulosilytica]MBB5197855.1 transcriptional regulator with XRE-family HTH domain [Anaerocolumna cellulosilytica]BCJ93166.1 class I SAM-dependent methyltransferase [Anaerocolumna cellulosilytica]